MKRLVQMFLAPLLVAGAVTLGGACDLFNPCGLGYDCQAGACVAWVPSAPSNGCSPFQPCPDGQACQTGACVPEGEVSDVITTGCNPFQPCPTGQACQSGACVPTDEVNLPESICSPFNPCAPGFACESGYCVNSGEEVKVLQSLPVPGADYSVPDAAPNQLPWQTASSVE
jgi:hypothetical protein